MSRMTYLQLLRCGQWSKNLVVLVPWMTSLGFKQLHQLDTVILSFIGFCLFTSVGYIINDVLDQKTDRHHPAKSKRPIANGQISSKHALVVAASLFLGGSLISYTISINCLLLGVGYVGLVVLYSIKLKKYLIWDIFVLASFYLIRIWFGGIAIETGVSFWLEIFALFVFLALALQKRLVDIKYHLDDEQRVVAGRAYGGDDLEWVVPLGFSSIAGAVVVFFLYLDSDNAAVLYKDTGLLALLGPVLMIFLLRVWIMSVKGLIQVEALHFVLKDACSYVLGVVGILIVIIAS